MSYSLPISANTAVCFETTAGSFTQNNEYFYVDDVSITYDLPVTPATGANPPDLIPSSTLYALVGGESVTITYNVTVDSPFPTGQTAIINTAATTSVQYPVQLTASVTDIVSKPNRLTATVAGRVWLDANNNSAQDIGEPGIANVVVTLKDNYGAPVATLVSDSNGRFLFTGVSPGNGYYVEATAPPDPAGLPLTNLRQSFPFATGSGTVTATNGSTTIIGTGTVFTSLAAGDPIVIAGVSYAIQSVTSNTQLTLAASYIGTNGSGLSYVVRRSDYKTTPFNLSAGQDYTGADEGYVPATGTVSFGDLTWLDADGDGLRDAGEVAIGGIDLRLYRDANGNGVLDALTDTPVAQPTMGPGVVAATLGSPTVVGSGTTFTNLAPGDPITIDGVPYTIASIAQRHEPDVDDQLPRGDGRRSGLPHGNEWGTGNDCRDELLRGRGGHRDYRLEA